MNLFLKTKDFSVSKEDFELHYDADLEMLATRPQPSNLDKYYESEAYISHTDSNISFLDKIYQRVKRINLGKKLKLIENQCVKCDFLLDFGAGTGDFLATARKRGFKTMGIEPNKKARDKAKEKGVVLEDSTSALERDKFDVITLWHVLEHLPNLNDQISELRDLLAEEGLLVIAVPNYRSFDAKFYGKFWAAYDVPRHLWHFSRASMNKLFDKHQLEVVETKPMLFDAFYVSMLSEKYKGNRFGLLSAFCVGLWSNIKAAFTKEHSSIIYLIKRKKTDF